MQLCVEREMKTDIFVSPGLLDKMDEPEFLAATELRYYLSRITTAPVQIREAEGEEGIFVGSCAGLKSTCDDEFDLVCEKKRLLIGGGKRGLFYAVYELLERLGCRFFTPECEKIPLKTTLAVEPFVYHGAPAFEYREMDYSSVTRNPYFCTKMRLNGHYQGLPEVFGGSVRYAAHAHSFSWLVPVEEYGQAHPEYYSLVDGKRLNHPGDHWQLCLTNPEIVPIAAEAVKRLLRENPGAKIVSLSQNDNLNACRCEACRRADREEGSPAGTLLRFVRAVGREIRDEFPDVTLDILAYHYTRPAPKKPVTDENVCVRLCASGTCFAHPYEECGDLSHAVTHPDGTKTLFIDDLRAWSRVCRRLYVWDYTSNFQHYAMPFANWAVLKKNLQCLQAHGVKGVFEEANRGRGGGVDFNDLRCYLLSKLLWDPSADTQALRAEFMEGVFGPAAGPLTEYLDLLTEECARSNWHLFIQERVRPPYLSEECLQKYAGLFDEAEKRAAGDGILLARVQKMRLSLRFCELFWAMTQEKRVDSEKLHAFFDDLRAHGIRRLDEWTDVRRTYRGWLDGREDGGRYYTLPPVFDNDESF